MDAFEISGHYLAKKHRCKSFQTGMYPQFDISKEVVPDWTFNIIFAEQVIEHILYPYRAVRNVYAMLRPGGYFVLTLPFLIKIHN